MPAKRVLPDRQQSENIRTLPDGKSSAYTRLQTKILQILSKNRDTVLETGEDQRRYHAYLPALLKAAEGKGPLELLVVVGTPADVQDIEDYARLLFSAAKGSPRLIGVGSNANPRKEVVGFEALSGILVGTPERIIDHLRRENLDLKGLRKVVIDCPGERDLAGFAADIEFIYSRTGIKPVTLVLTETLGEDCPDLTGILRRPKILPQASWRRKPPRYRLYLHDEETEKSEAVLRVIRRLQRKSRKKKVFAVLRDGDTQNKVSHLVPQGREREAWSISDDQDTILFDHVPSTRELALATSRLEDRGGSREIILVAGHKDYPALVKIEENIRVSMKKFTIPSDDTALRDYIAEIVEKIKSDEDPRELSFYKKVIRKNVSIFLRGYFAAFLLKELGESARGEKKRRSGAAVKNVARGDMVTVFFGLGKNRKVFPRDITALITGVPGIDGADIGEIKILDNYSFVDVAETQAATVIEKLNGIEFRGRRVVVNFARKKENSSES